MLIITRSRLKWSKEPSEIHFQKLHKQEVELLVLVPVTFLRFLR